MRHRDFGEKKSAIKVPRTGLQCSEFRPNVRGPGRTPEIEAESSEFQSDVQKNGNEKCDKGSENELPEFFVEAKLIF